jgi:hypothetical protein
MRGGAVIMLIISLINFISLLIDDYYIGGKVIVASSAQTIIAQLALIIFLSYFIFKTKESK